MPGPPLEVHDPLRARLVPPRPARDLHEIRKNARAAVPGAPEEERVAADDAPVAPPDVQAQRRQLPKLEPRHVPDVLWQLWPRLAVGQLDPEEPAPHGQHAQAQVEPDLVAAHVRLFHELQEAGLVDVGPELVVCERGRESRGVGQGHSLHSFLHSLFFLPLINLITTRMPQIHPNAKSEQTSAAPGVYI